MPDPVKIEDLAVSLVAYVNTNYKLLKLEAAERSSVIGSALISWLLVAVACFLFLFFFSLWAAFYISAILGNSYAGFLITTGFYFLVGLILVLGRKKLLDYPLKDWIIRKMLGKDYKHE